jgi:conjugal transfer pilus assembly protein TrbC
VHFNNITSGLIAVALGAWSASNGQCAERLPTTAEIEQVRIEQPLPSDSALNALKFKNSIDTAEAFKQTERKLRDSINSGLPNIGTPEGVDIQSLVDQHYANRQIFEGSEDNAQGAGLLYFASFSIPKASLERVIDQAERCNATLVLRGLAKDRDLRETAELIGELLKGRKVSFLIDPTLFSRFSVTQAPTIVLTSGDIPRCVESNCNTPLPTYWAVAGDVSLDYALTAIVHQSPDASETATPYLAALQRGFHDAR